MEITAWAEKHFQKSFSVVNTGHCAIHKCRLKLYLSRLARLGAWPGEVGPRCRYFKSKKLIYLDQTKSTAEPEYTKT